jgi:tetratricopeptide (TPR) repeat protein
LGPNNPQLISTLLGLGSLYTKQSRYEQAIPVVQRAYNIAQQHFGLENPQTARCLSYLGALHLKQEHHELAEQFLTQSLAISERLLVPDHPDIALALEDLSLVYQKQGLLNKAITSAERALKIRVQANGDIHPQTIKTREQHAHLLQEAESIKPDC